MIIDIHYHLITDEQELTTHFWKDHAETFWAPSLTEVGKPTTPESIISDVYPTWVDPNGSRAVAAMDEAGIEKTVILCIAPNCEKANAYQVFNERNKYISQAVKQHPERLILFCGVHPLGPNAVDVVESGVADWGAMGVKLDPLAHKFYPSDKLIYPLYEKLSALNLPILVHAGPRPEDTESRYGHPSYLDQVLADFPNLTIIAAHLAFEWWRELIQVAQARPNLMCDFSAYQLGGSLNYERFCHVLRKVIDGFGRDRVLFGTDAPMFDVFLSRKDWVQLIKSLPYNSPEGINFTEEEITALLGGNAERLLFGK